MEYILGSINDHLEVIAESLHVLAEQSRQQSETETAKVTLVVEGKKHDVLEKFKSGKEFDRRDLFAAVTTYREHLPRIMSELVEAGLVREVEPDLVWKVVRP